MTTSIQDKCNALEEKCKNLRSRCTALEEVSKMDDRYQSELETRAEEWVTFGTMWLAYGKDAQQGS